MVWPADAADVAARLADAPARGALARGLGRSYGDAAQNAGGRILMGSALDRVHAFDPERGRATVGAGLSVGALIRQVLPAGWFPAVTPGTREVSVGGAVAADVHGKNHHRDGSFCEHVLALDLVTPGGELLRLTPDETPDAFWATAGGMGLTGVVVAAELALRRVETPLMVARTERTRDLEDTMARLVAADRRSRYTVAWVDLLARGGALGRGVLSVGEHARAEDLPPAWRRAEIGAPGREWAPTVPPWPGRGPLTPGRVRAGNALYHRRAPLAGRDRLQSYGAFFYPLDRLRAWNRLYGRLGLLQYQLAVPEGREGELRGMVERLAADGVPTYLAVLKRLGPGRGPLAFPLAGWTLALDIPAGTPGLAAALDRLDAAVAYCGGRVYLAKDARLRPDLLPDMYPRLGPWREARAGLDPGGVMRSDLSRRVGLVDPAPGRA